ncbi:unnamed protein product [Rhizoctonia solani]|uniref:proline dehydrogenase n=1 Tax=Rhizoctonia solani TaxID=456999 RepID=A0A8H2XJ83_9AGAM|nr:unnamed protein product [Rhizoctonia solani]
MSRARFQHLLASISYNNAPHVYSSSSTYGLPRSFSPSVTHHAKSLKELPARFGIGNTAPPGATTLSSLARSYLVYSLCSVPPLVNNSPSILKTCSNIPGLRELSEAVVRRTFFAQFVGGDSLPDTLPLITSLRQQNMGTLLVYSVEADGDVKGAQWEKNVQEILSSVNFAGDFEDTQSGGRKTWVAVKLTALLPSPDSLKRLSTFLLASRPKSNVPYPGTPDVTDVAFFSKGQGSLPVKGLSSEDITALHELYQSLRQICAQAKKRGVRITVDAEHSWYQPGIDAFVTALSREFNQPNAGSESKIQNGQPVVYGTYQAYLRRTPLHLSRAMEDAKRHGYSLGVKLVRGAYHGQEIAYHERRMAESKSDINVEPYPAVWLRKEETDRCFDEAAELLIRHTASSLDPRRPQQPKLGMLFGTHNKQSCQKVLDCMVSSGLAHKNEEGLAEVKTGVEDMVCFGQLYGMRDELTNWIASVFKSESPMAFKYLPYGALAEVMPYLSRRAIENQSVLSGEGGAAEERRRAGDLIRGDTCEDTLPLITSLREQNKGTLLAYSVEVDENQGGRADQWKRNVEEMIASVEFAGDFEDTRKGSRKTWVAIKLSALVPSADSLKRMSKFLLKSRPADDVPFPGTPGSFDMVVFRGAKEPLIKAGLTEEDIESLRVLYEDLRTVCNRAKERGIRLIFDAEHTWYQPGIDAFVLALSREFNKPSSSGRFNEQPLVYATYQAYLKRTPLHLARSIEDAQAFGYTLGVKLVRGAYYDKETAEYPESQSPNCPVMPYLARRADPTTIRGKFLVGYQGWFTCPNDGPSVAQANEWAHWTDKDGQFNAELLPDPEYYSSGDLAVMPRAQHRLFSSRNPAIIRRHLNIMAMHGIDGLFLTRRGSEIAAAYQPGRVGIKIMKLRSEGINNIFRAAEQEARVVSIMYDLNGLPSHQIEQWIMGDWDFMINSKNVLNSPAYVREHGQPVVALWSVGFKHAGQEPEMIMRLISRIRELAGGAYIILGVPITWQKQDQNWQAVYSVADAIAPMCIGTFQDESGAERFSKDFQQPGIQASKSGQTKTDYVGVVWPGNEGPLIINTGSSTEPAPRQDGAFFWRQIYNGYKDGVRFMYAEMFDGFEEGTAILPSLGAQSDSTPSDWYLRIAGSASEALKGEKRLYEEFPRKELFEYWSTRPRYEERDDDQIPTASGSANPLGGFGPSAHVAQASAPAPPRAMTVDMSDAPPPYSIEDDSLPAPAPSSFTTEPESLTSGPANPASPITSYHNAPFPPADRPPVSRVDSTHSVGSHGSYPGQQQHRPEPIAVPGNAPVAIAVQTPTTYTAYTTQPQVGFPSGPAPPMAGIGGQTSPSVMPIRPPQHPFVASRPPAMAPRPPSRPGRPQSSDSTHPSPPPNTFTVAGIGGLTDQLGGMNIGEPNRPAPEHVFAGANQPRPQMTQPPGTPNSPFEGINYPGRFGGPDARRDSYGQTSGSGPSTPSVGMPGNPLYPAPLQGGGLHTSPGPIHQHSPGPVHQATLFGSPHNTSPPSGPHPHPQHQSTLGPGQYAPPSPHHRPTLGPTPTHQSTLGPGTSQSPRPSFQPHQQYAPAGPSPNPPGQHGHLPASGSGQYPPQGQGSGGQYNQGPGGQYPPQGPSGQHPYGPGGQQPPQSPGSSTHSGHSGYYGGSSPSQSGGHSTPQSSWPPQAPGSYNPHPPQGPGGPGQQQVYGQGQGQGHTAPGPQYPQWNSMAGGQYVDTAIGIIGKYAGQDTKKKVEQGLEGAFKVGTKVWGRLHNNK